MTSYLGHTNHSIMCSVFSSIDNFLAIKISKLNNINLDTVFYIGLANIQLP